MTDRGRQASRLSGDRRADVGKPAGRAPATPMLEPSRRMDERPRTVSEQELNEEDERPKGRKFPTSIFVREHPAILAVDRDDGTEDQWDQQERDVPRHEADNQR